MSADVLEKLYQVLLDRKNADPKKSYVSSLYQKGSKKIAKKLGEEAVELVIEAIRFEDKPKSDKARHRFAEEAADLMFHYLVLLSHHDVDLEDVFKVLEARLGVSGLEEKASRKKD